MSEWKEKYFDDFSILNYGDNLPSTALKPYGYRVFGANGFIGFNDKFNLEKQTVLISCRGENSGTINLVPEKTFVTNNSIPVVIKTKDVDTIFLFYKLQTIRRDQIVSGSAQPQVTINDLKKIKITFPFISEQRQIATILSTADAVIEKTQAAIAKYKAIKQGMLQDLFTRGIDTASGKLRPSYQDAPKFYKESKLGWIPKEWEVEEFHKNCDLITDGSHFSPKPSEVGEIIANVKDMGEFEIDYDDCTRISTSDFVKLKNQNCSPKYGDVLLSKDGTIGKVILFKDEKEIVVLSSIAILRTSFLLKAEYLYTFLKSEYFDKQLLVKVSGSALRRIVLRDINTLLIAFPKDTNEQVLISEKIIQVENKLQTEQDFLHKQKQIKAGLMNDLLSGRKKVKVKLETVTHE
jgi:type I restriction enzyme S subunit